MIEGIFFNNQTRNKAMLKGYERRERKQNLTANHNKIGLQGNAAQRLFNIA